MIASYCPYAISSYWWETPSMEFEMKKKPLLPSLPLSKRQIDLGVLGSVIVAAAYVTLVFVAERAGLLA